MENTRELLYKVREMLLEIFPDNIVNTLSIYIDKGWVMYNGGEANDFPKWRVSVVGNAGNWPYLKNNCIATTGYKNTFEEAAKSLIENASLINVRTSDVHLNEDA